MAKGDPIITRLAILIGFHEPREIVNVPAGAKVRLRIRESEVARAFVRTKEGTTEYLIERTEDGRWSLTHPQGLNFRP